MDFSIILFYYTMLVLLVVATSAASCFAIYLVQRVRSLLYATVALVFYFFDVCLVFQDDFLMRHAETDPSSVFFIGNPFASILIGGCTIMGFWLVLCEYLGEDRTFVRLLPAPLFVLVSLIALIVVPVGNVQVFVFYSVREVTLYAMLFFAIGSYLTNEDHLQKMRMKRDRRVTLILLTLITLIVVENVIFLLIIDPQTAAQGQLPFFPERNIAENILVIFCSFTLCKNAWEKLSVRHSKPPTQAESHIKQAEFIEASLLPYATKHHLSARETEIMRLVLLGKDNQNIATEVSLAPGTIKVHVHNILQKTGCANRIELTQDFWNRA